MALTIQQAIECLGKNAAAKEPPIEKVLKILGFLGDVRGLHDVLEMAVELEPQFLALRAALPGLCKHIDCYLSAGRLLDQLSKTEIPNSSDHHEPSTISPGSPREAPSGPIGVLLKDYKESKYRGTNTSRDFLSIFWLFQSIRYISAAPKINTSLRRAEKINNSDLFVISNALRERFSSQMPVLAEGLTSGDLWTWLRSLNEVCWNTNGAVFGKIFRRISVALARLNKEMLPLPADQLLAPLPTRSLRLEERYLSIGHWGFPRPHEIESLQNFFLEKEYTLPENPLFFEKMIVALAVATARTIEEVLHIHIDGSPAKKTTSPFVFQELAFVHVSNHLGGTSRRAVWVVPSKRSTTAIFLPLPASVGFALLNWVKPGMCGKIIDLLPPSATNWLDRTEDVVTKTLGCTKHRANRILRDSLLRLAYDNSSNRATVALLASNRNPLPKLARSEQLALSHYLDPLGARTLDIYKKACHKIFSNFGSGKEIGDSNCHPHGEHAVKITEHQAIAEVMLSRVNALSDGNNPIALHNAFACYCLLLLIVSTGHRRSRSPFFFPWDLHVDEHLAFICDKAVVGSEARFVPLAETTADQIKAYFRHLVALQNRLKRTNPLVREHIDKLVTRSPNHGAILSHASSSPLEAGLFFLIRENGSIETLRTSHLDVQLAEQGYAFKVHNFRAALADAIWGKGFSGIEVATLLGHSNELHPFGPASVWSVKDWAERIRPSIQTYLDERGWRSIESPLVKPRLAKKEFIPAMPGFSSDNLAYEGRARGRKLASFRALKAVRAVLSEDFLSDPKQKIDDERLGDIKERIAQSLSSDEAAKSRVLNVLDKELDALRAHGTTISAPSINMNRTDPSPVEISFGRHLAVATAFRQQWIDRVGTAIGGDLDILDIVERAAHLAISMVVLDGLLDSERVKQITLCAIKPGEVAPYPDAIVLRATVSTPRFEFDYALLPGAISSALTLGLQKSLKDGTNSLALEWGEIEQRISKILNKTFGRNTGKANWKMADLCGLFRSWWFIRLPGAVYSITIGDHNGPAPHPISEASLLADDEPKVLIPPLLTPPHEIAEDPANEAQKQKDALDVFNFMKNTAAGVLEEGTERTRIQRSALYRLLTSDQDPQLAFWMQEQPIVDALVGFLFRLLDEGGPRKKVLRFSSMNAYISQIASALIAEAWDASLDEMIAEDYEDLYRRVKLVCKDKKSAWMFVLRLFHQHLRESIDAPYVSSVASGKPIKQRCRSSLLTLYALENAWNQLSTTNHVPSAMQGPSKSMLALGRGYALRATEAIGLTSNDFDQKENALLSVQKNAIRDLKTNASRRVIPFSILSGNYMRHLTRQKRLAEAAPGQDRYLFGSSSRKDKILSRDAIVGWVKTSLRAASANGSVVFHDLRRSFATALTLAILPARSESPLVQRARGRLVESAMLDESNLRKLTRTPNGSPFLVDGVARILGHKSVDTLHDVYAHGTFLVLADHARFANREITVKDMQLACMLGVDRTAISHARKTLMHRMKDKQEVTLEDVVRFYINIYFRVRTSHESTQQSSSSAELLKEPSPPLTGQASWVAVDRLLCVRKQEQTPLEILKKRALDDFEFPEHAASQFIEQYKRLVLDVGFDDFEPDNSDLIKGGPVRGKGVLRGRKEREASLAEAEKKYRTSAPFRGALQQVCRCWLERIEPQDPWLVCKTQEEFVSLLFALDALGTLANQIELEIVGPVTHPFISYVLLKFPGIKFRSSRLSRGPKKAMVVEVGARIRQAVSSRIGDGRDFHRLILILSIGLAIDAE